MNQSINESSLYISYLQTSTRHNRIGSFISSAFNFGGVCFFFILFNPHDLIVHVLFICRSRTNKRPHPKPSAGARVDEDLTTILKGISAELVETQKQLPPNDAAESFFDACAKQFRQLDRQKQSYLQAQFSQLFYNVNFPNHQTSIPNYPIPKSTVSLQTDFE